MSSFFAAEAVTNLEIATDRTTELERASIQLKREIERANRLNALEQQQRSIAEEKSQEALRRQQEAFAQSEMANRAREDAISAQEQEAHQRAVAEQYAAEAKRSLQESERERKRAEAERQRAEKQLVYSKIARAAGHLEAERREEALSILETIPFDQRTWEVRHLIQRAQRSQLVITTNWDHFERPVGYAFGPEEDYIVVTTNNAITAWSTLNGEKIANSGRFPVTIKCMAMHPDGELIAVGTVSRPIYAEDGSGYIPIRDRKVIGIEASRVAIWNMKTQKVVKTFEVGELGVNCLKFSPDGREIAAGIGEYNTPGRLRIWSLSTGAPIHNSECHKESIQFLDYHPEGHTIATGSQDGIIKLWDCENIHLRHELAQDESRTSGRNLTSLSFSPNGRFLVSRNSDGETFRWTPMAEHVPSPISKEKVTRSDDDLFPQNALLSVEILEDGFRLVPRSHLLDPADGRLAWQLGIGYPGGCLDLSPDGRHALFESQKRISCIDTRTKQAVWSIHKAEQDISTFDRVTGWPANIVDTEPKPPRPARSNESICRFSPNGQRVLHASLDGWINLRDSATGAVVQKWLSPLGGITAASFDSRSHQFAVGNFFGDVFLYDLTTNLIRKLAVSHDAPVDVIAFCPDGRMLASLSGGLRKVEKVRGIGFESNFSFGTGNVILSELSSGKVHHVLSEPIRESHSLNEACFEFSPDAMTLLISAGPQRARWDVNTGRLFQPGLETGPTLGGNVATHSQDGMNLAVSIAKPGDDGQISIYDAKSGRKTRQLSGAKRPAGVAFAPKWSRIVVWDDSLREGRSRLLFYDRSTGQLILSLPADDDPSSFDLNFFLLEESESLIAAGARTLTTWDDRLAVEQYIVDLPPDVDASPFRLSRKSFHFTIDEKKALMHTCNAAVIVSVDSGRVTTILEDLAGYQGNGFYEINGETEYRDHSSGGTWQLSPAGNTIAS
ncbi:MAG: hypothetical protein KDA80_03830 [Planctomycetaceae bacterium]|nr:hypothetical protein [Planctomycetaceae bacterium]